MVVLRTAVFEVVARADMQLLGCYEVVARQFWIVAKLYACSRWLMFRMF